LAIKDTLECAMVRNEFTRGNSHINGIELFRGCAKTRLVKFKEMDKNMFKYHFKECEFRFNNSKQNIYKFCLELLEKNRLSCLDPFFYK